MSLVRYSGRALGHLGKRKRGMAETLLTNPHVQRLGRMGVQYAAGKINAAFRNWRNPRARASSGMSDYSHASGQSGGAPTGNVPSSSSSRYVSRPGRRAFGKYKGKAKAFRSRRGRRRTFRRRRRGGLNKLLWNMVCTPQELKYTGANYAASMGYGVRTWFFDVVGSLTDLKHMSSRRPNTAFFMNSNSGTATSQTPFGEPRGLHVSLFKKKYLLQNRCNWMMHLKVYECLLRRDLDLGTSGTTAFNTFCLSLLDREYNTLYNKGPVPVVYGVAGNNLQKEYNQPTFTPYNSTPFCGVFKVLKCTSLKLSPNDYVSYTVNQRRRAFDQRRIDFALGGSSGAYPEGIGGWTKVLAFTWVGGPVDTGKLSDVDQSKAANTLALQWDTVKKWWYEHNSTPLHTIASSNATGDEKGFTDTGNYKTLAAGVYGIPFTEVVETIAAPAVVNTDDVETLRAVNA